MKSDSTKGTTGQSQFRHLPGKMIWHMPRPFGIASVLGRRSGLRCVLFHDISDQPSPYTSGLGVTMRLDEFERSIRFIAEHYTPVNLEDVLDRRNNVTPREPILVTFDDVYASVAIHAAPICKKYGVPAVVFVNARFIDNADLSLDNLICYVGNSQGMGMVDKVARTFVESGEMIFQSINDCISKLLPLLSLESRIKFQNELARAACVDPKILAREAGLYLSTAELRQLSSFGFEIGNHTYSHVHGRQLQDEKDYADEIDRNKTVLETLTGRNIRAYSVPYGSSRDLPTALEDHLKKSGCKAMFLVESRMNSPMADLCRLHRVSVQAKNPAELFSELEILPRLRSVRDVFAGRQDA